MEQNFIVDNLEALLTCNYKEIPAEVLYHKFPFWSTGKNDDMVKYTSCLRKSGISQTRLDSCRTSHISKICPKRFGTSYANSSKCHEMLDISMRNHVGRNTTDPMQKSMDRYLQCRDSVSKKGEKCVDNFSELCKQRKVQSIKTVRGRMTHAEMLLERIPDLKVIHLYRKPAPVMPSRRGLSVLSLYGAKDLVKEAELYCRLLIEDILLQRRLSEQYPGQVKSFVFQEYTRDTKSVMLEVLEFVGLGMDRAISAAIDALNTKRKNKSTKITTKKKVVYPDMSKEINNVCKGLFDIVGEIWHDEGGKL